VRAPTVSSKEQDKKSPLTLRSRAESLPLEFIRFDSNAVHSFVPILERVRIFSIAKTEGGLPRKPRTHCAPMLLHT
jgi:hypothetical protein